MRFNLRFSPILLICLVAIGGFWSGKATSETGNQPRSAKPDTKSATLVIDFGKESGRAVKVIKLANLNMEASGWDVLAKAEVDVQGTDQFPTGFVCRIQGWPSERSESCQETPSYAKGHWAYFLSSKALGGSWILSGQGAAAHVPQCGDIEGWKWVAPNSAATEPSVKPAADECLPQ